MSVALPPQRIGSEAFTLLTRLFAGLKRRGRVIDVIWFQQSAEYARAVLELADECDDEQVRAFGVELRTVLASFTAPPPAVGLPLPPPGAPGPAVPGTTTAAPESADRYVGRLR